MNTDQWIILSAFIFIIIVLSYIIFVPSKKTHPTPHPTPQPTPHPTPQPTPQPTPEPNPPQPQSDTTPQQNQELQSDPTQLHADVKPLPRPRPNSIIKEENVRVRTLPRKSFFSTR